MIGVRRLTWFSLFALSILAGMAAVVQAEPTCKLNPTHLTICHGSYALCDKATCQPIAGTQNVTCTCPVLTGPAIASLAQLKGSCTPPPGKVYSLFSTPGFDSLLRCPKGASHYAQCWNATCILAPGGKEAACTCPLCTGSFSTPGGDCNVANCSGEILVGSAFPVQGGGGCKGQ
ncbi:MAG TPA: hypothetical protein VGR07_15210 [Thermoanaerobaculia bacterium]|jgi:hypothetical protein|nr:hypothetical protein [Thermoanaerobaculia bacterium]